jgi:hypothetical protein
MTKALLALHVIAAILAIGPVAVAASMFPATARRALTEPAQRTQLALLHRICNVYAVFGMAVPVFGFAIAASLHVLGSAWLVAAMALTAVAAVVLGAVILPTQQRLLGALWAADGDGVGAPGTSAAVPGTSVRPPEAVAFSVSGNADADAADADAAGAFDRALTRRLAMCTGTFNLLWATVTVLMILRPGSTTGV